MKLNKERQQMYLNGTVGLINDGTVEQLWEVANTNGYKGNRMFYHKNSTDLTKPNDGKEYHPIAWFYDKEPETRKPTAWKLNIDVPEWDAKAGTVGINHKKYDDAVQFNNSLSPKSLLPYIATPIYGTKIKLESGAEIELSENDIENIKKL